MFIKKIKELPDVKVHEPSGDDYQRLASYELNGREVRSSTIHFP